MGEIIIIDDFRLSAGGVLIDEDSKMVCIIKSMSSNEYLLPKGGRNPSESLPAAAQREVFEETGYENKIFPEKLLGIHIRPQIDGMLEEHKVIYWYYSKLTSRVCHEGTQEEDEDFLSEWQREEEAVGKLSFHDDKILVKRAFQSLSGIAMETKVEGYPWPLYPRCGSDIKSIRYIGFRVVKGFVALDAKNQKILLSFDCVTDSWVLPTESSAELFEIMCGKLKEECAPFLFEVIMDAEGVSVRQWYLADMPACDLEHTQIFNKNEALIKLKNSLQEMRIVRSAFRKSGCYDEDK